MPVYLDLNIVRRLDLNIVRRLDLNIVRRLDLNIVGYIPIVHTNILRAP